MTKPYKPPAVLKVNMHKQRRANSKGVAGIKVSRATPECVKIGRDDQGRGRIRKTEAQGE